MTESHLHITLSRLSSRAASSVVARSRIASPALNAVLLRRLSAFPGQSDALLADPVFEAARDWEPADCTLDDLAGGLLHSDLVAALDEATEERMPRDRRPWSHQLAAWEAARDGLSCVVSSGTGSGKTECFMIPMLDDLLRQEAAGSPTGIRAIVIYPLNALIESQRERLAAWTAPIKDRVKFALYNGLTPETKRQEDSARLGAAEIGNRRQIRENPPAILVTNITMLEYLLLRSKDRPVLDCSHGLLRWIVLDEAHTYIGAQAAEMALLLRRVRAAFGVQPEQVRLMATSATIGEGSGTEAKLRTFASDLAGVDESRVHVIQGRVVEIRLPPPSSDDALEPSAFPKLSPEDLWRLLATHPRVQQLKATISDKGATLSDAADILFDSEVADRKLDAQTVLDAAARARRPGTGERLLSWRAHLFHRALGGVWVCVDPCCAYRDPELQAQSSDWGFGAVWLKQRDRCDCDAPVFELLTCNECGNPSLVAGVEFGALTRLAPIQPEQIDEFSIDEEPEEIDPDAEKPYQAPDVFVRGTGVLSPPVGTDADRYLRVQDGVVFDNTPPSEGRWVRITLDDQEAARACCPGAANAPLAPQRYGPPFFMGVAMPSLIESLATPLDVPGRPLGGRRALTFSDSRQGTARLAAKLQQDAERNLTRAFLYHAVQSGTELDESKRLQLELKRQRLLEIKESLFREEIRIIDEELRGETKPISWPNLVETFAQQRELREFATEVWRDRAGGGREMAQDPVRLSEMFLYRELLRRPKVQNNAETMGLVRLSFPDLERKAKLRMPDELAQSGVDTKAWAALALAAIDFVFRERLATWLPVDRIMPFVSPRSGRQPISICRPGLAVADRPKNSRPWPGPVPVPGRPSRLHRLVYALTGGDPDNRDDQDQAGAILSSLWNLIVSTAARDIGGGAYQLEFQKAAVARLESGWVCPVTRRIFGYSPAGRSPYDPNRRLDPVDLPRLPMANSGGLDPDKRAQIIRWCEKNERVAELRRNGLWTDLHDRTAAYAPFLRSQEHSAQIERPVLADYERLFKDGQINLLNCSTTMEMGIDIPNVQLVANGNSPPSISNYRQRLGRAGRRGEPWAFGLTFCRDLPLDRIVFENPGRFLRTLATAPTVRLDSPGLVARHVHAALLGAFLRDVPEGFNLLSSTGAFFGATEDAEDPIAENASADDFLLALRGEWASSERLRSDLARLTKGTALAARAADYLTGVTAESFERLLRRWRDEYIEILSRREAASEPEVKQAFATRARRMKGEFLLAELARRGFTPSYGFPVDVVSFDHLSGRERDQDSEIIAFGDRRGGASRTLDIAIREYAPGAEIVVDGLVHRSEGVLPAWRALADASQLEDLQYFWECSSCRAFGMARLAPEACPECHRQNPRWKRGLRPAGFLGRRAAHTGYENLGHAPYELPKLSASKGIWRALPHPKAGRYRADSQGQIVALGSGPRGNGYALCLDCGRAEVETEECVGSPMPSAIKQHLPLASARGMSLKGGYCSGGFVKLERIQRNVRFIHETQTDVFELQLPAGAGREEGLALAAGLREALAARLGAEVREIGVSIDASKGRASEGRVSAFLYDRASGGAGFSSRMAEPDWFEECLKQAAERLSCVEDCSFGCPACVLRPDLNFGEVRLDRVAGLQIALNLLRFLEIPEHLRVFGPDTRLLDSTLYEWIDRQSRAKQLNSVALYLHGPSDEWELADWPLDDLVRRLKEAGTKVEIVLATETLTNKGLAIAQKLDLHRLSVHASLGLAKELPFEKGTPVLASINNTDGIVAVATSSEKESLPGPHWGLGEEAPLVRGETGNLPNVGQFDGKDLISLSSGNARLIRIGAELDGAVREFGRTFWNLLDAQDPLAIATIRTHGVSELSYTDRYLLTPLALRLLVDVLARVPGGKRKPLNVATARSLRKESLGWTVFHNFIEDTMRRSVMQELFPKAHIDIREKGDLPHERSLQIRLSDGRRVTVLFDQGFGAWRALGIPRYDFSAQPAKQAQFLKSMNFFVEAEPGREVPVVLQVD
ncbi:MAG: DEAD/DEAH box helicase [Albidovulum sp.]|nr:DEAD/DEAH box helicase [Albidovulum sp.]